MKVEVGYATHRGLVRKINQDTVGVAYKKPYLFRQTKLPLFVLADGMGGHGGGEVASNVAVESMLTYFNEQSHLDDNPAEVLHDAVAAANEAIMERGKGDVELQNMGTTIVAASMSEEKVYIANVGDSRAYLIAGEHISQITKDHSLVAEMEATGQKSPEKVKRNVITRAVGRRDDLEIDLFVLKWQAGDTLLLCSDGLWDVVSEEEIWQILSDLNPEDAADRLVEQAMDSRSTDNISAIIIKRTE